jgi:hypothetical protein
LKSFLFYNAYELAHHVQQRAEDPCSFIEVPWDTTPVMQCLIRPSKLTLLHYYVFATIAVYYRYYYRDSSQFFEREDIIKIEDAFKGYNIAYLPLDLFAQQQGLPLADGELDSTFYRWFRELEDSTFTELWNYNTDEIFNLLFADRRFLLTFNRSLAEYLSSGHVEVPRTYLTKQGKLRRCTRFPEWLTRAIYLRDKGRCVFCNSDISGLLHTDFSRHIDHIVPLARWGTNDPCNLQLTCESCNLSKSARPGRTSTNYLPWWDD